MIQKIAFIGATGTLGRPVAFELTNAGFEVSALVRNLSEAKKILPAQINLYQGDLKNKADVLNLLEGKDALYLNLNLKPEEKKNQFHTESDGLKIILDAAKEKKIKRIGFLSSIVMRYQGMNNFDWWVFDLKAKAVQLIKESEIPYTIFYPSTFMENFEGNYRQGNKILLAGTSMHKMFFIAGQDYGKRVASAFRNTPTENKEYVIQGPEAFTADEAALEYIKHYSKSKLKISKAPLGVLKFVGKFVTKVNYASHIIEALNNYPETFEADQTWKDLGAPTITLRQFAEQKGPVH
jgi:uncharacterized protein YbjT (DUF2867 family)